MSFESRALVEARQELTFIQVPRARLTLRTAMFGIAVLACSLGAWGVLWRRSADFRRMGDFHRRAAMILGQAGGSGCMDVPGADESLFEPTLRRAYLYHRNRGRQYSRVARRPWLSVPLDPMPPWAFPEFLEEAMGDEP